MVAFVKFESFVDALAQKKINLATDSLKIALVAVANAPDAAADAVLADIVEISYTNLSARVLTTLAGAEAGGIFTLTVDDLTLTASGGAVATWRYVVIYSDTAANKDLIGYWDAGADVTMADTDSINLVFSDASKVLTIQ